MTQKITKTILFLLLMNTMVISSCGKKLYPETAELTYLSSPQSGVVELASVGYGAAKKDAELDTYTTAFNNILFKGIPGFGALRLPMIENERESKIEHPGFYRKLFDERGYLRFITSQGATEQLGKSDDQKKTRVKKTISIDYESLRRFLEQEGVIRKFGY
jgi:hypothetical protein